MLDAIRNMICQMTLPENSSILMSGIKDLNEAKDILTNIQLDSPKQFMRNMPAFLEMLEKFESESSPLETYTLMEIIVSNVEFLGDLYQALEMNEVMRILMFIYRRIVALLSDENPFINLDLMEKYSEERYSEKEDPISTCVMNYLEKFSRVTLAIDLSKSYSKLSSEILKFGEGIDWRLEAASFIMFDCLVTMNENLGENKNDDIYDKFFEVLIQYIVCPNPRVRYYAVYCLGEHYCDIETHGTKFVERFFTILMEGIQSDIDIVCCNWIRSFVYLFEIGTNNAFIPPNVEKVRERLYNLLGTNNNFIIEKAFDYLESLSKVPRTLKKPQIEKGLELSFNLLSMGNILHCQYATQKCLFFTTSMMSTLPPSISSNYIEIVAENLLKYQQNISEDIFLSCWKELCHSGVKVSKWTFFVEKILTFFENREKGEVTCLSDLFLFKALKATLGLYKENMEPYSMRILEKLRLCFTNSVEQVQKESDFSELCLSIQKLSEIGSPASQEEQWNEIMKEFLVECLNKITVFDEDDFYIEKLNLLYLSHHLLKVYGHLIEAEYYENIISEIWALSEGLMSERNVELNLMLSDDDHEEHNFNKESEDNEESDEEWAMYADTSYIDSTSNNLIMITKCLCEIPDLFQNIVPHLENNTNLLAKQVEVIEFNLLNLTPQLLESEYGEDPTNKKIKEMDVYFSLNFVISFVEFYIYESMLPKWGQFCQVLETWSLYENPLIRGLAIYGLGLVIDKTPEECIDEELGGKWLQIIKQCLDIKNNEDDEGVFYSKGIGELCVSNSISTWGKLIFKLRMKFSLISEYYPWLMRLPLKNDRKENRVMINILKELLTVPSFFTQALDINLVITLLRLFSSMKTYLDTGFKTMKNLESYQITKSSLLALTHMEIFIANQENLLHTLSEDEKEDLNSLMNEF